MANDVLPLNRRELLAGLGTTLLAPALPAVASVQGRPSLTLTAKADSLALSPGGVHTPVWSLGGTAPFPAFRFKRGDTVEVTLQNDLPVPVLLNWHGIDGVPAAEPLGARAPLKPAMTETVLIPMRHAGIFMYDLRLLGDGQARPSPARALVAAESEAVAVDRDEVLLLEDWRLRPDGAAIAPGTDPKDATPLATINGQNTLDITARANERLRLRFINAFQRNVIALKIDGMDVRVMALDGHPAEPFLARNGAVVLAPGGRADAFIDVTVPPGTAAPILLHDGKEPRQIGRLIVSNEPSIRNAPLPPPTPLPSNGLPTQLGLTNALRVDVTLGGSQSDWVTPANFAATSAPAFRAKRGRIVVLALTNRAETAVVFHLHGHHFRLLDRLDDGWKPFWLDTLAVEAGQTQRIAFAVEYAGRWLIESFAANWAAPRLVRWYSVE